MSDQPKTVDIHSSLHAARLRSIQGILDDVTREKNSTAGLVVLQLNLDGSARVLSSDIKKTQQSFLVHLAQSWFLSQFRLTSGPEIGQ